MVTKCRFYHSYLCLDNRIIFLTPGGWVGGKRVVRINRHCMI